MYRTIRTRVYVGIDSRFFKKDRVWFVIPLVLLIDSRHNFTSQLKANLRSHTILLSPSHGQNFEELAELFLFREGRFSELSLGTLANSLAIHRSHAPDWHLASGLFAALQR